MYQMGCVALVLIWARAMFVLVPVDMGGYEHDGGHCVYRPELALDTPTQNNVSMGRVAMGYY